MPVTPEKLLDEYHNSTENEKLFLQLFSSCFLPLDNSGLRKIAGPGIDSREIVDICNRLHDSGLLLKKENKFRILPGLALPVLRDALKNDKFVRKHIPNIFALENNYRWTESAYRHLRNLLVQHYLHNGENEKTEIDRVRYNILDLFDYLQPVVNDPGFNWLFLVIRPDTLSYLSGRVSIHVQYNMFSYQDLLDFDAGLQTISGLLVDKSSATRSLAEFKLLDADFEKAIEYNNSLNKNDQNDFLEAVIELYNGNPSKTFLAMHKKVASKKKSELVVNYP